MNLAFIDWLVIAGFFMVTIGIGVHASRTSGRSFNEYFLAGGKMKWWLLGISMVATTFAADTPNLVTDIVRKNGVSGNWVWWAFLLTGLLTVFVYAKLWKRSGVVTDLEFYELRYSGNPAAALRGFRAIYLGVVFNCVVMANVMLAAIKLGGILLDASPIQTVVVAGTATVIYTFFGGLRGVILTDFFQFIVAMFGAIAAAVYCCGLPEVGGVANLLEHPNVAGKLAILPDLSDMNLVIPLLIIPLGVQWWASWYPGAEPGGGGYVAQRMLGAASEKDATTATLLFQIAHYALRPWPWIFVALASLVVYPEVKSIAAAFPDLDSSIINDDLAYPAMLTRLPAGLLGLVVASLVAAFMSTISTHLNWGGSYIAHDFYRRFIDPTASEKRLVWVGRLSTIGLMLLASGLALSLENALSGFNILLQIGAGTGAIYILRWFWWRINAYTEITGMVVSFLVAIFFHVVYPALGLPELLDWQLLLIGVCVTTTCWLLVTFVTPSTDEATLENFYRTIRPSPIGWRTTHERLAKKGEAPTSTGTLANGLAAMACSTFLVYALLFGIGQMLYGLYVQAGVCAVVAGVSAFLLSRVWPTLGMDEAL